MNVGSEICDEKRQEVSALKKNKRDSINLAADPSDLLSKEGFALYIGYPGNTKITARAERSGIPY
ncbi:hypothetical protein FQI44_03355 [Escherichia coli]|nr:hypothetical protein [Escherichia coli]